MDDRLRDALDKQIEDSIKNAAHDVGWRSAREPADVMDDILKAMQAVEQSKRTIVCLPETADLLREQVRARGLEGLVEVLGSPHCEPGIAYVMPPGIYRVDAVVNFRPGTDMPILGHEDADLHADE